MNDCLFLQNEVQSRLQSDGQFFNIAYFIVYLVLALSEYTKREGIRQ